MYTQNRLVHIYFLFLETNDYDNIMEHYGIEYIMVCKFFYVLRKLHSKSVTTK